MGGQEWQRGKGDRQRGVGVLNVENLKHSSQVQGIASNLHMFALVVQKLQDLLKPLADLTTIISRIKIS